MRRACSSTSLSNWPTRWFSAAWPVFMNWLTSRSLRARTACTTLAFDELLHQQAQRAVLQAIERLACSRVRQNLAECVGASRSARFLVGQLLVDPLSNTRPSCVLSKLA